jgi:DNA-binding NarL/FixJ family response regulator
MLKPGSTIRVLVVDDHDLVRRSLCDLLDREPDIQVVGSAGEAEDAYTLAVLHQPDIILMDIDLNGTTSLDTTVRIREESPRSRIIFVSAFTHDRYIDFALDVGAFGFISKREAIEGLAAAIRIVATGGRYFSPDVSIRLLRQATGLGPPRLRSRLSTLTPRQFEILVLIANGRTKVEIAKSLNITVKTVETHCETMMCRLLVNDRVGLTRYAIRENLVQA